MSDQEFRKYIQKFCAEHMITDPELFESYVMSFKDWLENEVGFHIY